MSKFLDSLIAELNRLPGIGAKSAEKIAYFMLKRPIRENEILGKGISELNSKVRFCSNCGNFAEAELCEICSNPSRDRTRVCVVEEPKDIRIFEKMKVFQGLYHVLGGVISPINGVSPEDLFFDRLIERVKEDNIIEIIVAFNQTTEGELTGLYLNKILHKYDVKVTKLLSGIPVGSDLEYIDILTLSRSFEGRQTY